MIGVVTMQSSEIQCAKCSMVNDANLMQIPACIGHLKQKGGNGPISSGDRVRRGQRDSPSVLANVNRYICKIHFFIHRIPYKKLLYHTYHMLFNIRTHHTSSSNLDLYWFAQYSPC